MQAKIKEWNIVWAYSFEQNMCWVQITLSRSFSESITWWFSSKNCQIFTQNLSVTEYQYSQNEMWCVVINHIYFSHISAKGFFKSELSGADIDKNMNFSQLC